MPKLTNPAAVAWAKAQIAAGNFDASSAWEFSAGDAEALLGDPPDWPRFALFHLEIDTEQPADSLEYYASPIAKAVDGEPVLFRSALTETAAEAGRTGDETLRETADELLGALDQAADEQADAEESAEDGGPEGGGGGGGKGGSGILPTLSADEPDAQRGPAAAEARPEGTEADQRARRPAPDHEEKRTAELRARAAEMGVPTDGNPAEIRTAVRELLRSNPHAADGYYKRGGGSLVERAAIDEEKRTAPLRFSSETPVLRWYGYEVLDHGPAGYNLERLRAAGPILVEHRTEDHVGTVQEATVGSDRVGRAIARFGRSARAVEIFQDIVDGIRKSVSVGYYVHGLELVEEREIDGEPVYRANWEPVHVAIVAEPADVTAKVEGDAPTESEDPRNAGAANQRSAERSKPDTGGNTVDVKISNEERKALLEEDRERARKIRGLGDKFADRWPDSHTEAQRHIDEGKTVEEFRAVLLENLNGPEAVAVPDTPDSRDIGLSQKEAASFRFIRLFNALANPADQRAQKAAGFELEACAAFADQMGRGEGDTISVPPDVLRSPLVTPDEFGGSYFRSAVQSTAKRLLSAGGSGTGAEMVATDLLASSFIDLLRNSAVVTANATMLRDLNGNVDVPKLSAGASGGWINPEGDPAAEQTQTTAVVQLTPKTVGAWTKLTRRLLIQSSPDVEAMVRRDLANALALALDFAAINGAGAAGVPKGIAQYTGIGAVASSGDLWNDVVDLETEVAVDNANMGNLAYAMNAKTRGEMKKTPKETGQAIYIYENGEVNGYPGLVSNQFEDNLGAGNDNRVMYGNWADLMIAIWGGLEFIVDRFTESTAGNTRVTALQEADVAPRHEESFAMMDDLTIT